VLDRIAHAKASSPAALRPPRIAPGESRLIGRGNACDYAIADPTVSTRHAELVRLHDGWLIRDLGSRNGTRVNGWLVKEQRLHNGDTLALGSTVFSFEPLSALVRAQK
jgi:two-component system, NtrC family, response regulator HydG